MGLVTDTLIDVIIRQVAQRSPVVWYDPEGAYGEVVEGPLESILRSRWPDAAVFRYQPELGFLALRHDLESGFGEAEAVPVVIYVLQDREQSHRALIEYEASGCVVRPGQQPPEQNSGLAHIARQAFHGVLPESRVEEIVSQTERGQLSLSELDALPDKIDERLLGVITILFDTGDAREVSLRFLSDDTVDAAIEHRSATQDLSQFLGRAFGIDVSQVSSLVSLRSQLARYLLVTDLCEALDKDIPPKLARVAKAEESSAVRRCVETVELWRAQTDLGACYVLLSEAVWNELGLAWQEFSTKQLRNVRTFASLERALLVNVQAALLEGITDEALNIIAQRKTDFWAAHLPDMQAGWALTAICADLLREAARIEVELGARDLDVERIFQAYTTDDRPWYLLDTHQRHLERIYYGLEMRGASENREKLVAHARQRYTKVGGQLAQQFLDAYQEAGYSIGGAPLQRHTYARVIAPNLGSTKMAYVWVDALRYEMAAELAEILADEYDLFLSPAVAAVPTITSVGMAALLPGGEGESALVLNSKGMISLTITNRVIDSHQQRIQYLKDKTDAQVCAIKLEDLVPHPKGGVRQGIQDADLVLVHSQEIDALGESGHVLLARRVMDGLLHDLRRGCRALIDLGIGRIVLAADHGYLFGEALDSGMKIDPPGGQTAALHRRVWVGRGGMASPSFVRMPASSFGFESDLELAVPCGFGAFKVAGGGTYYFHGGLSPQELVVPVCELRPRKGRTDLVGSKIAWTLSLNSASITSRAVIVNISGLSLEMFELIPPQVHIEVAIDDQIVSTPFGAVYGFEPSTGDVRLAVASDDARRIRPNSVSLVLTERVTEGEATIRMLDAVSGMELAHVANIRVSILE